MSIPSRPDSQTDPSEDRRPLVEMINIHKRFGGVHAVQGVSIDLYPGEVAGILGTTVPGKPC